MYQAELVFPGGASGKKKRKRKKYLPVNVGDVRDTGLIPGLQRSLEKETVTHSSILTWRIPWTEKPGRLWSIGSKRV